MKKSIYLLLFSAIIFSGCNQSNSSSDIKMVNDTYHQVPTGYTNQTDAPKFKAPRGEERESQIAIAKIKAQEKLDLARIEAEAKANVKRIEAETLKAKSLVDKEISSYQQETQKEIATSNQEITLKRQEKDLYLYKIMIGVIGFIVLIGILVVYLVNRENRIVKVKLEEDRIKHEEFTQANNQYHEKTTKILDIISDKNSDDLIKQELVKILGYQEQNRDQILISSPPTSEDSDILEEEKL